MSLDCEKDWMYKVPGVWAKRPTYTKYRVQDPCTDHITAHFAARQNEKVSVEIEAQSLGCIKSFIS